MGVVISPQNISPGHNNRALSRLPLMEFTTLAFNCMPGKTKNDRRWLRFLLLCSWDVFRALMSSLVCWFFTSVPGFILLSGRCLLVQASWPVVLFCRGPGRSKPYKYVPELGVFTAIDMHGIHQRPPHHSSILHTGHSQHPHLSSTALDISQHPHHSSTMLDISQQPHHSSTYCTDMGMLLLQINHYCHGGKW